MTTTTTTIETTLSPPCHHATDQSADPTPHLTALRRDGYVVVPSLLPPHLLLGLQAASKYLTAKARAGEWPYVRTVPKQYPPWQPFQQGDNIWGIQHLLHPDMPVRDVYAEVYFSDHVLAIVSELVGQNPTYSTSKEKPKTTTASTTTRDNDDNDDEGGGGDDSPNLVMELFNLLISPSHSTDFSLQWHRDDIRPDLPPEEELRQLNQKSPSAHNQTQLHAQYNIALFPDSSLIVIPGSHARIRTDTERNASPYEPNLPGQVTVHLNPGDAVFYDSNILHRGVYLGIDASTDPKPDSTSVEDEDEDEEDDDDDDDESGKTKRREMVVERMTLHGSVGLAGHGDERARQVLQHAVGEWVDRADFPALQGRKRRRADGMKRRLVEMGRGEGLGYSLEG